MLKKKRNSIVENVAVLVPMTPDEMAKIVGGSGKSASKVRTVYLKVRPEPDL
ncbi:MAG: hypothetical protein F6K42_08290 [Leptolyngbya sp. SIO1D8]|nr:hypothetical protein [Leptolyngbya sp. SIO1D8]